MNEELLVAVLAAGASRRLGRPKQLVKIAGEPLVRRQCRIALDAALGPVVLVLGCHRELVDPTVADLRIERHFNAPWQEGMASSIRAAAEHARDHQASALLLFHVDQYTLTTPDLVRVRDAWRQSPRHACLARDGEYLGPPAVLPASFFDRLLQLRGDIGARAVLAQEPTITETPVLHASYDIDEPSDLARVQQMHSRIR